MENNVLIPIFTLGGVIVGAISSIAATWISEYYRNIREKEKLIHELGKIYWQEALIQGRNNPGSYVYPLESFILSVKYLFEEISSKKIDEKNVEDILMKHSKLMKIVKSHYDKK